MTHWANRWFDLHGDCLRSRRVLIGVFLALHVFPGVGVSEEVPATARLMVLDSSPHAVVGRPIAVPIRIDPRDLRRSPPLDLELQLDDETSVTGLVAWLGVVRPADDVLNLPTWTGGSPPLRVVPAPQDPSLREDLRGVLLLTCGDEYSGSIRLGDQVITPLWLAPAPKPQGDQLAPRTGPAWPPLDEPADWWRWALLADSMNAVPPPPQGGSRTTLIARNIAALWRSGLNRIALHSAGAADELRDLLVSQCTTSKGMTVAAWITDTAELNSILGLILGIERSPELAVRSLLFYLDARFPILAWPSASSGSRIQVALANPTDAEQVVRIQWVEDDPVPVAAVVPPGRIVEVLVDRPLKRGSLNRLSSAPDNTLILTAGALESRLKLPPERLLARPPGLQFGPFLSPRNLEQTWSGEVVPQVSTWSTSALLRKRRGRWELFIECLSGDSMANSKDRLEVHLGLPSAPVRRILISPDGELIFSPGAGALRGADVSISHFPDRWRAVLRLQTSLVESAAGPNLPNTLLIGMRRLLDGQVIGVSDGAVPVWNPRIPVLLVDLSVWGDIPSTRNPSTP